MGMTGAARTVEYYLKRWDGLKSERLQYEYVWQQCADYILPRTDFSITQTPKYIRPRRYTNNVAPNANDRFATFLLSYIIDPSRPFIRPNVRRGMVAAGRATNLSGRSQDYLGGLSWQVYDRVMLPQAQLQVRLQGALKEFGAFGNCVMWCGRKRGFGPVFNSRPLNSCWWSENEHGEVDVLYYLMKLPRYRVIEAWPNAALVEDFKKKCEGNGEDDLVSVLHCVEPRPGGRPGAVKQAKPFASVVLLVDEKVIIEEDGYDGFPYGVGRYELVPGRTYAFGPGAKALPDVKVINNLVSSIEDIVENRARPPLMIPARLIAQLDRRPGAVNAYNPAGLGLQKAADAVQMLNVAGDLGTATALLQMLTANIESAFFVDWMRLRETGNMTATEINDRRDLRLRGMAGLVSLIDRPLMGRVADRTLEVMNAEHLTPPPPPELSGVEVDWEFAGPLTLGQLQGAVQANLQFLNACTVVAQVEQAPGAAKVAKLEENLRSIADGLGLPPGNLMSREEFAEYQAQQRAQAAQQHEAAMAQAAGQTARDAGSGLSSMTGAAAQIAGAQQQQQGGGPSGFAPVAPFAQAA